nr:putative transposase En/Spm [Ipomoea batatas]
MSQPPSLRAIINDPKEGNAHIRTIQSNEVRRHLENTGSERTASTSRESEHTTEAVTEHTSQPASKPSTSPSTIPNDHHLRVVRVGLADKSKTKPHWIADDVLDDLVRIWDSEDFNKKEKLGKDPSPTDLYQQTHKRKNGDGAYVCAKAQKVVDTMNELRQTQTEASDVELWLEATGGVKMGGYVYGYGSDTQHYFPEASKKSKSQAGASSSNAALMAEIQEMREENKIFREENKFIREKVSKMGAIFAQFSANPEFLRSLNLNNSGSQNDETQAHCDED